MERSGIRGCIIIAGSQGKWDGVDLLPLITLWQSINPSCFCSRETSSSLTIESLEAEALRLSAAECARLITSLDADPEVEEAWATEVERRHAEIESKTVSLLPGAETLAKLRTELR